MKKLLRLATASTVVLGLTTGIAAAQSGSISTTGPDSTNKVISRTDNSARIDNDNDLTVRNTNDQHSSSGDAKVRDNTTGGDATSGDASNSNSLTANVTVDNSGSMSGMNWGSSSADPGSIDNTGPDSSNVVVSKVKNTLTVNNDNNVSVQNTNNQSAYTGDASVSHNTTGGSATTGSASNTNSTDTTISVTN